MVSKIYNLQIDIMDKTTLDFEGSFVQGDTKVNIFNITLVNGDTPVDLSDVLSVTITFLKQDYTVVIGETQIVNPQMGYVTYLLGSQEVACAGKVLATVELYGQDNMRLTSSQFQFSVRKQLANDNAIESSDEYSIITNIINSLQGGSSQNHVHLNLSVLSQMTDQEGVLYYHGQPIISGITGGDTIDGGTFTVFDFAVEIDGGTFN